ncbi:hypothetical protein [Arthrobacter sp. ISL-5]|uniref:hypothetical protein n=1 Tax=Arthrobacter sp. ISL-5 TaxID=2819111 RepID=UPI001BE85F09|nr:hypothetical protein [Arthrobacter sp. ISL-5]MBT2555508.1 hypothetical protein [Arthrobacter sp. ISL-5]
MLGVVSVRLGRDAHPRPGTARTDILAVKTEGQRPCIEVQVKTSRMVIRTSTATRKENGCWHLGDKDQLPALSTYEWYALILVDRDPMANAPRSFIVPRDHVAAAAWIGHMHWRTDKSVPPGRRNAPTDQATVWVETFEGYRDKWELLDMPTDEVPVLLPEHYQDWAAEEGVGLPPEHPWTINMPEW